MWHSHTIEYYKAIKINENHNYGVEKKQIPEDMMYHFIKFKYMQN